MLRTKSQHLRFEMLDLRIKMLDLGFEIQQK